MASIRFENGSQIDLYVGDTVYRDVQVTDMQVDYGETDSIEVSRYTFPIVTRGASANNIYFDNDMFERWQEERIQKLMAENSHLFNRKPVGFKSINLKPKTNRAAKQLLSLTPDEL
jgi:uncharacterized protein (DUF1919 family)